MSKIVQVLWKDFEVEGGWHPIDELQKIIDDPCDIYQSVGYLIDINDERVLICASLAPDGAAAEIMRIPSLQVVEIHECKVNVKSVKTKT